MRLTSLAKVLGVVVLLVAGAAVAADVGNLYVSGTWRYKISVEIETPEGVKTGSAVHELSNHASASKFMSFPESGNAPNFKGEAVAVDLGKQGIVFAILPTDPYRMFFHAYYGDKGGVTSVDGIRFFNSLKVGDKRDLQVKNYPSFVMFKDIRDPITVMIVRGSDFDAKKQDYVPVDRFSTIYGDGVKVKNISLEITDQPIDWEIEKRLSWILDFIKQKKRLNGSSSIAITTNEVSDNLGSGNFRQEGK